MKKQLLNRKDDLATSGDTTKNVHGPVAHENSYLRAKALKQDILVVE